MTVSEDRYGKSFCYDFYWLTGVPTQQKILEKDTLLRRGALSTAGQSRNCQKAFIEPAKKVE